MIEDKLFEKIKGLFEEERIHTAKLIDNKLGAFESRLEKKLNQELQAIRTILVEHTKILQEHTRLLHEHSRILAEHSAILAEHSAILAEHSAILAEHTKDIKLLKKKVSYIKKTMDVMIDTFNREDIRLIKRVDKIEEHLGLPSLHLQV